MTIIMTASTPAQTLGHWAGNLQLDSKLSVHIEKVSDFGADIVSLINKGLIPSATANKVHKIIRKTFTALEDLDRLSLEKQDTYVHTNRIVSSEELKPIQNFFLRHELAFPTKEIDPFSFRVLITFQERITGTSKQIMIALNEKIPYFTEEALTQLGEIRRVFTAAALSSDHATISSCKKRLKSLEKEWDYLQNQFQINTQLKEENFPSREAFEKELALRKADEEKFASRAEPLFENIEILNEYIYFALEGIKQERSLDAIERGSKESAKDLCLLFKSLETTRIYLRNFERNVELPGESSHPDIVHALRVAKGRIEARAAEITQTLLHSAIGPIEKFRIHQESRLTVLSSQLSQDSEASALPDTTPCLEDEVSIKELIAIANSTISENESLIAEATIELFLLYEEELKNVGPMLDLIEKKFRSPGASKSETFLQLYQEVKKRERFITRELTLPESPLMQQRYEIIKKKLERLLISLSQKMLHMFQADLDSSKRNAQALIEAPVKDQAWIEAVENEIEFLRDQFPDEDLSGLEEKDSKQLQTEIFKICCRLQNELLNTKYKNLLSNQGAAVNLPELQSLILDWSKLNTEYRAEMVEKADEETLAVFCCWSDRIHELQSILIQNIRESIDNGFIFLQEIDTSPKELAMYESISTTLASIEECEKTADEYNEILEGHEEKEKLLKEMSYLFTLSHITKSFVELLFSEEFHPQTLKNLYPHFKQCSGFKTQVEKEISEPKYRALFNKKLAQFDAIILKALHRCLVNEIARLGIEIVEPETQSLEQMTKQALDYLVEQAQAVSISAEVESRNASLQSLYRQVLTFHKTMRSFFNNSESARDIFIGCKEHSIKARNMILEYGMQEAMRALDNCEKKIKRLIPSDTSNEGLELHKKLLLESLDRVITENVSPYDLPEEDIELPSFSAVGEKYTTIKEEIETLFTDPRLDSASTLSPYEPFRITDSGV